MVYTIWDAVKPHKPDYSAEAEQQKLVCAICNYFGRVYDDKEEEKHRILRGYHRGDEFWQECMGALPTINETTKHFSITPAKVRKLLIAGGCYRTKTSEEIRERRNAGEDLESIGKTLGIRPATVRSYLPYDRVIYNLQERSVTADRLQRFKQRHGSYRKSGHMASDSSDE